jgi:GAF domain-containing protein
VTVTRGRPSVSDTGGDTTWKEVGALSIEADDLADVFVDVADTLVADFDLIEFLHSVARHATRVSSAAAAGVLISGRDRGLHHVGASSDDVHLLELFQIQYAEGPCVDCYASGERVLVRDLTTATDRWPEFAPRALELGMAAVYAFPMRLRDRVIGGLNVFHTTSEEFGPRELRVLQALADVATISLIQEQAIARAEVLTEQLQLALNSRIVVEQAKGAVARTFGISVDAAFELLRRHARATQRRLTDVAHEVVESPDGPQLLRPR